jgi:hypothetical protein
MIWEIRAYHISNQNLLKLMIIRGFFHTFYNGKVGNTDINLKFRVYSRFFFNRYSGRWSPIGSTWHCGHQWPIVPASGEYDDGEIGGMIGRGNRSTRTKPAPVSLCPPQTPHAARTQTRAAAVGSQRLTA